MFSALKTEFNLLYNNWQTSCTTYFNISRLHECLSEGVTDVGGNLKARENPRIQAGGQHTLSHVQPLSITRIELRLQR